MANTIAKLTKRGANLLLGIAMLVTSVLLIAYVHVSLSEMLFTFNPYPFYFIGIIFGFERIFYGITGSSKLLSLINGDFSAFGYLTLFVILLTLGIYIVTYTIAYTEFILQILNALNGISYLLYALMIFKAWHM